MLFAITPKIMRGSNLKCAMMLVNESVIENNIIE